MKSRQFHFAFIAVALGLWTLPTFAKAAIVVNQTDDFQDGTVMNWFGGAQPTNIGTGGPAGAGDKFLQLTPLAGVGHGTKLATINDTQWTGNFVSQGVTQIEMDLRNPNATPLSMRIMVFSGMSHDFTSTNATMIPPDGLWHHFVFGLTNADMTAVDDGVDLSETLSSVARFLIRHQPGPPGGIGVPPSFVGQLDLDNIHAGCGKGDFSGDGLVTVADDLDSFVNILLSGPASPAEACKADMNNDGQDDGKDVQGFVSKLLGA